MTDTIEFRLLSVSEDEIIEIVITSDFKRFNAIKLRFLMFLEIVHNTSPPLPQRFLILKAPLT